MHVHAHEVTPERAAVALAAAPAPLTAYDVLGTLFRRKLDTHQTTFAMGEAIAHLTYALDGADTLVLTVEPKAAEGKPAEKPLVFRMSRVK